MILILREFRSRAGAEERVLAMLRKHAVTMIGNADAEAVVVCQRADLPQHLLWIQHHAGRSVPAVDAEESRASLESGLVEFDGRPVRLEFVDGAYQYPLPACRVWGVETYDGNAARTLLRSSRLAGSDSRICGVSAYRTLEEPSRMIAFFALARDLAPDDYFKLEWEAHEPQLMFYPLRVSWTVGRLMSGTPSVPSLVRYPRAAFWSRLGLVLPSETLVVTTKQPMGRSASQRS